VVAASSAVGLRQAVVAREQSCLESGHPRRSAPPRPFPWLCTYIFGCYDQSGRRPFRNRLVQPLE